MIHTAARLGPRRQGGKTSRVFILTIGWGDLEGALVRITDTQNPEPLNARRISWFPSLTLLLGSVAVTRTAAGLDLQPAPWLSVNA